MKTMALRTAGSSALVSFASVPFSEPRELLVSDIRRRARELWEKHNRPSDREDELWLEAQRQLLREASA
jgi:hypothetical protein